MSNTKLWQIVVDLWNFLFDKACKEHEKNQADELPNTKPDTGLKAKTDIK